MATILLALVLAGPAQAQDAAVGEVTALTGPATLLRDGVPSALRRGATLREGDKVVTLEAAKLLIRFADGTRLVLGPRSEAAIAEYAPGETGVISLLRGIVRAVLERAGAWRRFDIESRNAVASARSTAWIVEQTPDGTAVFVIDGEVAVSAAGAEVVLGPGFGTDVAANAAPGQPTQWGDARAADVRARTSFR